MNTLVNEMGTRLSSTKTKTRSLIDQTTKLQKDVKNAAAKKQIASAFIEKYVFLSDIIQNIRIKLKKIFLRFQLSPSELSALRSATVSPDMFLALERAQEILNSCKVLSQAGCQVAAQDIMEQMTLYQVSQSFFKKYV